MRKEKIISRVNPLFLYGICHRGLHNDKYTENGLNAFKNALDHHMAIELDIHLTKDNNLVVIHDSTLERVTGKKGIVEDLTLKELKENYRLLDGEQIPSLQEVFDLIKEEVPIVIELKVFRKNYKPLSKKLKEELKQIKDKRNIMLISFDPRALFPFNNEGFVRQLLVTSEKEYRYVYHFRCFFEGVDLDYRFMKEKRVRKYCQKHFSNLWTIESKELFDEVSPYVDTITFQLMDENYVFDTLKNRNK